MAHNDFMVAADASLVTHREGRVTDAVTGLRTEKIKKNADDMGVPRGT